MSKSSELETITVSFPDYPLFLTPLQEKIMNVVSSGLFFGLEDSNYNRNSLESLRAHLFDLEFMTRNIADEEYAVLGRDFWQECKD